MVYELVNELIWKYAIDHGWPAYPVRSSQAVGMYTNIPDASYLKSVPFDPEFSYDSSFFTYYGSGPIYSLEMIKLLVNESLSVNWDDIKPMFDKVGRGFNGTFAEECSQIPILCGILILKSGIEIPWICEPQFKTSQMADMLRALDSYENISIEQLFSKKKRIAKKVIEDVEAKRRDLSGAIVHWEHQFNKLG